jgi:hypothetical protein
MLIRSAEIANVLALCSHVLGHSPSLIEASRYRHRVAVDVETEPAGRWISAHDAAREHADREQSRHPCKTPGCKGRAAHTVGRHSYCTQCQIRRGTRRPDGSLVSGRIPTAPGSRTSRNRLDAHGPIEERVMELVAAARQLDSVLQRQASLRGELREASAAWHRALARLPKIERPG